MPDSAFTVRPATLADLDAVVAQWADLTRSQSRYVRMVRQTRENREIFKAHLTQLVPHRQVLVLEADGLVQGFAVITTNASPLDLHYVTAVISDLYVAPAGRGRGWGRALLDAAIAMIRDRGLHAVTLSVFSGNAAARALYRSAGFKSQQETLILPLQEGYVRFGPDHPGE